MRLAVLSDIHGNLAALEAVLADLSAAGGADATWCLGDLAAFGPRPAECIRRIRSLAEADEGKRFKVIGGNTDRYLVTGERLKTPAAKDEESLRALSAIWQARDSALNWATAQLSWDDYEYLKKINHQELSKSIPGYGTVIGYHAIPGNDEAILAPDTPDEEARDFLLDREGRLAIGGHTHLQMDRTLKGWHVVNVGSIGMPFDQPGSAAYGLFTFDGDSLTVDLRRVPFDIEAVIADLNAVGYPAVNWTAARLRPKGG